MVEPGQCLRLESCLIRAMAEVICMSTVGFIK